ncbi:MAG: serine/threonine protein kinase [Myxococcota bacterium]
MTASTVTDLFLSLTPDKVLEAVEAAGLRCNPVCYPLNSFENRVYEVELEDRTRVIAKFYRPGRWTRAQILEEHQFLSDLADAEVPVCPVLPFPDGETLHTIDNILYCLFERRGGRAPDEVTDTLAERLGMLCARIHNVGASRPAPNRLELCADIYIRDNLAWLAESGTIPPHLKTRYFDAANRIAETADLRMEGVPTHRVHGDMHLGNLLLRDSVFNVLDFDDMVTGPAVQDLWMLIPGRDTWARRQREAFIEGYQQLRDFDRSTLTLVEPLRGMRLVHYATWLAKRWHDPIFPRTWPHFGTDKYWQEETAELEDIVEQLQVESGEAPAEESVTLTNKDYFFDWEDN